MFLLRTAFMLSLVVLVLPSDARQQQQLAMKAGEAMRYATSLCDRSPALCEKSAYFWAGFREKAAFGGRLVLDLVVGSQSTPVPPARDTLRDRDRLPTWQGRS